MGAQTSHQPTSRQSTGPLLALAGCMALQMTGFVMILPLLPRRFDTLGAGVEAFGVSAMAYALAGIVAAPVMGNVADRYGRRPIVLFSLAAYVLAFTGYLLAVSASLLILIRGLAGLFTAGLIPAITSIVGDQAPEDRRGQWIGIVNGGASVGWIIGPLLGGFLYDRFGYVMPFTISIAMGFGALLLALLSIHETYTPPLERSQLPLTREFRWQAFPARPTFLLLMLITFGVLFAWAFIEPRFMFYAYDDLHWTSSRLGMVMSTYGVTFMLGEFTLGRLSDRLGRKPVLVLGLALFSAQFIGLVLFRDATWIILAFSLAGLGNALYDPALSALILDITPREQTASMLGLKGTAGSLGNLLGPALLVLFTPIVTPQTVFLIAATLVCTLALASGLVLRIPANIGPDSHATGSVAAR